MDTREPLLRAKQHKREHRRSAWHQLRLLALLALALLAAMALLLYTWAPLQQPEPEATEEEQRDSEYELLLLHEEPSAMFCSLPPPMICAHGGDTNAAPPNTAAAFAAAIARRMRCLEVDVARTKDGRLVVLHARELQHLLRLAGLAQPPAPQHHRGKGAQQPLQPPAAAQVGDYTWAQLRHLRWEGGEGVELVEAVLKLVLPHTDHITLDVKTYSQAGEELDEDVMAQEVVGLVRRTACRHCLVWAKSDAVVRMVKELDPSLPVGYVVMNETAAARALGMHRLLRMPQAEVVALHYAMAGPEVMQQARAARKQVHAWTANTASMMRAVLDAGVDAVVTNHPTKLADAVQSRLRWCQEQQGQGKQQQAGGLEKGQQQQMEEQQQELRRRRRLLDY